jgi:hypothetical protein
MANPVGKKILFLYELATESIRTTTREHLFAFQQYCPLPVDYVNLAKDPLPSLKQLQSYAVIVFHYMFLTHRWGGRESFWYVANKALPVLLSPAVKVILPQDEFFHADLLCEFINAFNIDCVFSVAPPSEWEQIYRTVDFRRVKFYQVLTGYMDEKVVPRVNAIAAGMPQRRVDIGYRTAGRPYFWFGRHGYIKQIIADLVLRHGPGLGLRLDIDTSNAATIFGDDWYRFLLGCKWTIGVESGTSVLDWDGTVHRKTQDYVTRHSAAEFGEVEAACFPGLDGKTRLYAIAPRHLEACLTRTGQILTDGEYNGILRPGVHYLPVRKDFSNHVSVLQSLRSVDLAAMTERAYQDVVASGQYTYRSFVEFVVQEALKCPPHRIAFSDRLRWAIKGAGAKTKRLIWGAMRRAKRLAVRR